MFWFFGNHRCPNVLSRPLQLLVSRCSPAPGPRPPGTLLERSQEVHSMGDVCDCQSSICIMEHVVLRCVLSASSKPGAYHCVPNHPKPGPITACTRGDWVPSGRDRRGRAVVGCFGADVCSTNTSDVDSSSTLRAIFRTRWMTCWEPHFGSSRFLKLVDGPNAFSVPLAISDMFLWHV